MTNDERLAYLLESIWVPTNRPVLFADITAVVGLEATALIVGTMKAASAANPLMDTIIIAMSTNGLSLSTAERQGVIDALATAGQWPDAVRDAVKALGGASKPRWQTLGYEIAPTLESVALAATKKQLEDSAVDALQAFREALSAWDGSGDAPVLGGE
jgi:enoyl-CoA hydratase/carnithine racemase